MTVAWFVRSRGKLVDHDYVWQPLAGPGALAPQELIDRGYQGHSCETLVNVQRPALILFGDQQDRLVLLVTGLVPKGDPADFLALTRSGAVYAWGGNHDGELGPAARGGPFDATPVQVALPGTATAVSAGCYDSLAVTSAGQVLAWGSRIDGELGSQPADAVSGPVTMPFPAGVRITQVSAGCEFNLALSTNGTVYAWGNDTAGQLGQLVTGQESFLPVPVPRTGPGASVVDWVSAGCDHALARTASGAVLAWGSDSYGQLGNGTRGGDQSQPVAVTLPGRVSVSQIFAGDQYSIAVTSAGEILTWGNDATGQLGRPAAATGSTPGPVGGQGSVRALLAGTGPGAQHGIAIGQSPR